MTPATMGLELYRGDSYHWTVAVWLDAAKQQPADLTGVTAKAQIRNKPAGTTIVAMTCSIVAPNIVDLQLEAEDSALLPPSGVWDLQLTWPSGDVGTILAGKVRVTQDVTDSTVEEATHASSAS